ncbi:class I SAM-dependent DNA methyltransferase [Actinokineospora sp. NPDC004072]
MSSDDNVYGQELSEVYDLVYLGRARDYAAEAITVAKAVRAARPDAASLLDVACGTGEHLATFQAEFERVEGVELSAQMCDRARAKLPDVPIHLGDMRDFAIDGRFDAVCCLFSSTSYMTSTDELDKAVANMAGHLTPGGVLLVDPWYFPETYIDGYISDSVVRDDVRTVARLSHSRREGRSVRQEAHFLSATERGIDHFVTVQRMTLFTREEYTAALEKAGCETTYLQGDAAMSPDRGMFVGVLR